MLWPLLLLSRGVGRLETAARRVGQSCCCWYIGCPALAAQAAPSAKLVDRSLQHKSSSGPESVVCTGLVFNFAKKYVPAPHRSSKLRKSCMRGITIACNNIFWDSSVGRCKICLCSRTAVCAHGHLLSLLVLFEAPEPAVIERLECAIRPPDHPQAEVKRKQPQLFVIHYTRGHCRCIDCRYDWSSTALPTAAPEDIS